MIFIFKVNRAREKIVYILKYRVVFTLKLLFFLNKVTFKMHEYYTKWATSVQRIGINI